MSTDTPEPDNAADLPEGGSASLFGRVRRAIRQGWGMPVATALLLAMGPAATLVGAKILAEREAAVVADLRRNAAPQLSRQRDLADARALLAPVVARPAALTIQAFAKALPADARLLRLEQYASGALEAEVVTSDPDQLRGAIRQEAALRRMRDASQRQADAGMIVTLRQDAP